MLRGSPVGAGGGAAARAAGMPACQVQYLDGAKEQCDGVTRPGRVRVRLGNGDQFEGAYAENKAGLLVKQGAGEYQWANGSRFVGGYDNDLRCGKGRYTYASGAVYEGQYVAGKRCGEGRETFANGDVFSGRFADDFREGRGTYAYSNGAMLTGDWRHGDFVDGSWDLGEKHMSTKGILASLGKAVRASAQRRHRPLGVVIAGAPASGKGTQCEFLREEFGLVHLSTGDMLRAAVAAGTPLGKQAKALMESGQLVPDDIVIGAVKDRLAQADVKEHGFLLDGFPRTAAQARALKDIGVDVDVFIMLNVPDEMLVERVVGRRIDPATGNSYHVTFNPPPKHLEDKVIQRADDTEEKVKVRLQGFHGNISDIKDFYKNCTVHVDGTKKKNDVWDSIKVAVNASKAAQALQRK